MWSDLMLLYAVISIHTPAKGVTTYQCTSQKFMPISIHTPAKGVTQTTAMSITRCTYFNPHSREGSDLKANNIVYGPANFNPHSREGSDVSAINSVKREIDFNPHSREGSDSNFVQFRTFIF